MSGGYCQNCKKNVGPRFCGDCGAQTTKSPVPACECGALANYPMDKYCYGCGQLKSNTENAESWPKAEHAGKIADTLWRFIFGT